MDNPFYSPTTTITAGDTSPGGAGASSAPVGKGPTIIDDTYSQGNPFSSQAPDWQQGTHVALYNKALASAKTITAKNNAPVPITTQIKNTITGIPGGIGGVLGGFATHPLGSAEGILGGLADVGPASLNLISHLSSGIANAIYGVAGLPKVASLDLPLPGQTVNEYIGNNSDVSQALEQGAKMFGAYELGGAAARGLGLGGVTVDAAGNTIPRATLLSRVAGNVIGGQSITDPNATLPDRVKQAAFDAAFGAADTGARALIGKVKIGKVATQAVTEAKGNVMNGAIDAFSTPGTASYSPDIATKLQGFLNSKEFDGAKNMVDFETGLQKALGDDFNVASVKGALQPIIDAGHQQVAETISKAVPAKPTPAANKPMNVQDLFDLNSASEKVAARADAKPAETKYVAKDNLGKDQHGNKRMAQTQVDTKTGNAIVYYDKSLDANPAAKKIVFDHEQGHIIDKRLNGGNNISAELGNYTGNKTSLDKALSDFAKKNQMTIPEAAAGLKGDIATLSGGDGPVNEQFADAVSAYRADPKGSFEKAPTFSRLMQYVPNEASISDHSTSMESLKQDSPVAAKMVNDGIKEGEKAVETHLAAKDNVVSSGGKHYELSGESLDKYKTAKASYDETIAGLKKTVQESRSASSVEYGQKQLKAEGMKFSALKRELTGDLTATEIGNKIKYEQSNYAGKKVEVEINGKKVAATINGKPAYGNIKVKLEDGTVISVKTDKITDPRSYKQIHDQVTARPDVKQYNPHAIVGKQIESEAKKSNSETVTTKTKPDRTPDAKIASTGLDTGKVVVGKTSFNPDKINAPQDVEKLFSKMDAENENFSEQRMSKSNEDIQDLARMVGLKPEDLINAKPGSIANAETLTAARQLVLNKAQALANRLKSVDIPNASDAELKALKDDYARLVAMQQTVAGLRTEAANTLRSLQLEVSPGEDFTLKDAFKKLQDAGIASKWDAGLFSGKVGKDIQLTTGQKIGQGLLKTWYASILSGPATPLRHGIGVLSNVATDIVSKLGNPTLWKEFAPSMKAFFTSMGPAFQDAKEAFAGTKPEASAFQDISSERPPVFTGKWSTYGKIVESVGRFMDAAATGYTRVASEVEKASLEVYSPGMGNEVQKAISAAYAESINYLGTPKGTIGEGLYGAAKFLTNKAPITKIILPFTKVVANVIDRQFDYIPGTSLIRATDGALGGQVDRIMTKFNLTSDADRAAILGRLRAQQYGRAAIGMAISVSAFGLARAGRLSGSGPTNYNEQLELERTGWQPNSIKIGNTWVPYLYFGPLAGILSMAGNINDAVQYDKKVGTDASISSELEKGIMGWVQSQIERSFLSGVSNLIQAATDDTKQQSYFKNLGAEILQPLSPKIITGTMGIIRGAMGENLYQTHTLIDKIRSEWGLTGPILGFPALEPQMNAFGEPLKASMIYGLSPTVSKADLVDNYLQANDIVISVPSRNTQYTDPLSGKKRSMTQTEYSAYLKESGTQIYKNLQSMIPELQGEDVDSQRTEIRAMLDSIRTETRDEIMSRKGN